AQSRPQPRPGDLVEQAERATLGGNSFAELAGKRPIERPAAISEAAQQQAEAAMAEAIAQQVAATVDTPPEADADPDAEADEIIAEVPVGTRLAVASSIQPKNRPRDIDTIVKRTESEPVRTASAATVRAQPAAPRIPQNSSVAGAATVKNQINLRQINLIGVFGTPSSRRALVRLSNGRLQNVKVGDRLDGGRVAAIGDTELQLNKNGRNVVLRMPNG
ncbi:pilus assembly protein PilP, partial [Salipiger sp. HF18]|nr:pilus assembly protein PilP [Salipiger sp. HF18]